MVQYWTSFVESKKKKKITANSLLYIKLYYLNFKKFKILLQLKPSKCFKFQYFIINIIYYSL